ncbi:MAG: hypothetical protein IV100_14910 [Myxococcales bacterium]|nr:hypothetical protein [Myxococcales bacterium]
MGTLRAFLDIFLAPVGNRFGLLGPKISTLLDGRYADGRADSDRARSRRVFEAMIPMRTIDVAAIETARRV